jgi:hypothetical protein
MARKKKETSELKLSSDAYYPVFLTTERIDGPRVAVETERIVIVLGEDEKTGLPLELSVQLRRIGNGGIALCAFREPLPEGPWREPWPRLVVEKGPVENECFAIVTYGPYPPPGEKTPA